MTGLKFEWDPAKAKRNSRKHNVTFEEAGTVFGDPLSATILDPDHSDDEDRFIIIGRSNRGRLLMVAHTERNDGIRIINARQLSSIERRQYEESGF